MPLLPTERKKVLVWLLAAAISVPLGYLIVFWSMNTYSFLSLYRPERLFQGAHDPAVSPEPRGTEILEALNAEIEQESFVKERDTIWLLARVDRLWHSVRRYMSSSSGKSESFASAGSRPPPANEKLVSRPFRPRAGPAEPSQTDRSAQSLQDLLSLSTDPEVLASASEDGASAHTPSRGHYKPLPAVSSRSTGVFEAKGGREAAPWLYRFESLKGVRTQSLIYQLNRNLALEGTVEAQPMAETDPDLSDFCFRTVHALNFLRDSATPSAARGYQGIDSGYPVSYGIGLNYQVSPLVNLRFDYSYETPHYDLVEYNGSWESSLMTNYDKNRPENSLSVHNFFLGLRYLYEQKASRIPLHTGFFYSTNMDKEPLSSNVSLGFSIGGGINRRDLHLGFAWRFRVWDNPEQAFLEKQGMQKLDTRVSNQFLFTLVF